MRELRTREYTEVMEYANEKFESKETAEGEPIEVQYSDGSNSFNIVGQIKNMSETGFRIISEGKEYGVVPDVGSEVLNVTDDKYIGVVESVKL